MEFIRLEHKLKINRSRLGGYWNTKLTPSVSNPYPLAPRDLVISGKVNQENYELENIKFGLFCSSIMSAEITNLANRPTFRNLVFPRIDVLGAGLGRDLLWINKAMDFGFYVNVYDVSRVACEKIESNSNFSKHLGHHLGVMRGKISINWTNDEVLVYFASQFVQVQSLTQMRRFMHHLGCLLRHSFWGFKPTLYLVHSFHKDNPGVVWGDTTPYSEEEMLNAMTGKRGEGLMGVELLEVHSYFHQKYSLLKIQAKG